MKRIIALAIFLGAIFGFSKTTLAERIVILYTGETHSDLYPCHCPIEPFGGLSRRATKIKELRQSYPNLLVVDSGGFFAGGKLDEYSVNKELDKQRTAVNLQALKMMGYDAVAIGDEEFNFGQDFMEQEIEKSKLPFLSSNIKVKGSLEYVVKDISGVKIGILGASPTVPGQPQLKIAEPTESIKSTVEKLKQQEKVAAVILLSHLGEGMDLQLLQEVSGIDFIISGHSVFGQDKATPAGNGVLLRPAWQGRKLGKLELELEKGKIKSYNAELIGLGKEVPDDSQINALLPNCFADRDCLRTGFKGTCENAGTKQAGCRYQEYTKIPLLAVQPKVCRTCNSEPFLRSLKANFPGLEIKYLDVKDKAAAKLIQQFKVNMLPAYFMFRSAEKEANFEPFKRFLVLKGEYYWFKPAFAGVSYFMNRQEIKNQLDLFIVLNQQDTPKVLETVRKFLDKNGGRLKFQIHFVAWEDAKQGFMADGGLREIEEDKIALCVMKHLPLKWRDYLLCRSNNMASSWWENCLGGNEKLLPTIKACAQGKEAEELLKENIGLTKQLDISYGPLFLLNNNEVFGVTAKTTVEELEKYIK